MFVVWGKLHQTQSEMSEGKANVDCSVESVQSREFVYFLRIGGIAPQRVREKEI